MAKKAYIGVEGSPVTLGDLETGSIVNINESGVPAEFYVAKHDYESTRNGTGRTLLVRKNCHSPVQWNSWSANTYATSNIDTWLNNTYKNYLDTEVQSAIGTTKFLHTVGGGNANIQELERSVFVLSMVEFGDQPASINAEGSKLPIADSLKIAYYNGSAVHQWTRSPNISDSGWVGLYNKDGTYSIKSSVTGTSNARPAFTLPSTIGVNGGLIDGSEARPNSVARKIKKGYIGIDNVARKIKKAYIGIGGVARPCWSGGELAYYGTVTPLKYARSGSVATKAGESYAVIANGQQILTNGTNYTQYVDAYNPSLVRSSASNSTGLGSSRSAASVGNYALFAGGYMGGDYYNTVDAYSSSLTKSTPTSLPSQTAFMGSTSIGSYALFGGGKMTKTVTTYNASLTRNSATSLSTGVNYPSGVRNKNYALIGGGASSSGATATVNAYNASMTKSNPTSLSVARREMQGATAGEYALFAGGVGSGLSNVVDAYDGSLTRTTPAALSGLRLNHASASIGNFAVFAGGQATNGVSSSTVLPTTVDVYDDSLTKNTTMTLGTGRYALVGASIGNFALFCGGDSSVYGTQYDIVEAFTVA